MDVARIRGTTDDRMAGTLRLLLAVLFVMTGAMKLFVPMLADARESLSSEGRIDDPYPGL